MKLFRNSIFASLLILLVGSGLFVLISSDASQAEFAGYGIMEVKSNPKDAEVYINGILSGRTPFKREKLYQGKYKVVAKMKGKTIEKEVTVNPNVITTVNFVFKDDLRVGYLLEDPMVQGSLRDQGYKVIVFEMKPPKNVKFFSVKQDDFTKYGIERIRKKHTPDGFIHLRYRLTPLESENHVELSLDAVLYNFRDDKYVFRKNFAVRKRFGIAPDPEDLNPLREQAYNDFKREFRQFLIDWFNESNPQGDVSSLDDRPTVVHNVAGKWKIPDYSGTEFEGMIDRKAPVYKLKDRKGKTINFADYFGKKVVLLYFWDASFEFCKDDMDKIQDLVTSKGGLFAPIAVTITATGPQRRAAESFLRARIFNFPVVFDNKAASGHYKVKDSVPLLYLIDKKGNVRYIKRGTFNKFSLQKRIDYLSKENL